MRPRVVAVFIVVVLVVVSSALLSSRTTSAAPPANAASWPYPNGDLGNTRDVVGSTLNAANVSTLKKVWSFNITGTAAKSLSHLGSLAANPVVVNGVVYEQDMYSNVYALKLTTGQLLWEYRLNQALKSGPGPNGVAVADGVVYGMAPTTAFALSATTGKTLWVDKKLLKTGEGTFGMQPEVANGREYLASQYGLGAGGGVLLALQSANGKLLWRFNTVTRQDPGVKAEGAGAGGAWETPLVSTDGSVTYGIGNPYQTLGSAESDPARQLYTDSDVNLNAATGKLRWYYQAVPNDFKDYDMQASPIAATVGSTPVVIGGGKMGIVYEMNATTGRLLWKTPVGKHNGHDDDSLNLLHHRTAPSLPYPILPGSLGGILTNMAVADGTVYVATLNLELQYTNTDEPTAVAMSKETESGNVEALNLSTGRVEWSTNFKDLPLGATTVVNDLVFTTLYGGQLVALNRLSGKVVYRTTLPTSTNAGLAIAGDTVIVPDGGPKSAKGGGHPQIVAYRLP